MTTRSPLRSFGIIAHVDAGKTTLTERMLYFTGAIRTMGEVHDGGATTDHRPEEQEKGITTNAATVTCRWHGHTLQLVDTPGHADFTIEVERSLRVLDGAVVLLDGVAGVEPQTEKVWRQAEKHAVPRIAFVNKLDRAGADFERCLVELASRLGATPLPLVHPVMEDGALVGLVDLVRPRLLSWSADGAMREAAVPEALRDVTEAARAVVVDACALLDAEVLERVVKGEHVPPGRLEAALRVGVRDGAVLPVLAGSAFRNQGVQPLLDAIVAFLPAPEERPPLRSASGEERPRDASAPLAAFAFKVTHDDHGVLTFLRVFAGTLRKSDSVLRARDGKRFRIGRLVRLFAGQREDVREVPAGGIAAVLGADLATGDTLCDPSSVFSLESLEVPEPVLRVVIEPKTREDLARLGPALGKLLREDPSLRLVQDEDTGQTLLAGMGELHLEIAVSRLRTDHRVEVSVGQPKVAYRETIAEPLTHRYRLKKQSGGPGQFADVTLEVTPLARGEGFAFEDRTKGGVVPALYVPAVERGCRKACTAGPLGHALVDVRVALVDGAFHANDSSEMAFQAAAETALRDAARLAGPVLLEPWARVEVTVPEASVGAVVGDLGARRGRVLGLDARGPAHVVTAEAPLATLSAYATALGSLSHGRGTASVAVAGYRVAS